MLNLRRWDAHDKGTRPDTLIVLCHGVGSEAEEMHFFFAAWTESLPHAAFLAPDGPEPFEHFPVGRQWFSLDEVTPAILDEGARQVAPLLNEAIDAECTRLGLGPDRVVLCGFSQGAFIALHAGLRRPVPPAAILAYSGGMPDTPGLESEIHSKPPVLLVHGEADQVVPFQFSQAAAQTLHRLGIPVETCWRPGLPHQIDEEGLAAGAAFLRRVLAQPA